MTTLNMTSGSRHLTLDASVRKECLTLLSGEGVKAFFSAEEAASQIASLLDIEAEFNHWAQVHITFTGDDAICTLLEDKLRDLGFTAYNLTQGLKVA